MHFCALRFVLGDYDKFISDPHSDAPAPIDAKNGAGEARVAHDTAKRRAPALMVQGS
jgi:hypothetical protein